MEKAVLRKKGKDKGFSLLEVLIAIVVLALVVAPILQTFLTTAKINSNAEDALDATGLAQVVMEELTSQTYEKSIGTKYTTTSPTEVSLIRAAGYNAKITEVTDSTIDSIDKFMGFLETKETSNSKQAYVKKWVSNGADCFAIALHNVKYNFTYCDVVFALTPSDNYSSSDYFFTYDVEMKVFIVKDGKHYKHEAVTIYGAVANKN